MSSLRSPAVLRNGHSVLYVNDIELLDRIFNKMYEHTTPSQSQARSPAQQPVDDHSEHSWTAQTPDPSTSSSSCYTDLADSHRRILLRIGSTLSTTTPTMNSAVCALRRAGVDSPVLKRLQHLDSAAAFLRHVNDSEQYLATLEDGINSILNDLDNPSCDNHSVEPPGDIGPLQRSGTIKRWDVAKGFGFIHSPDGDDDNIFCQKSDLLFLLEGNPEGTCVNFTTELDERRSKLRAVRVSLHQDIRSSG
mmetsp:Transcript_77095/g.193899  ORF Transcript_77095/g.193899 Transcript_77095/m.193899 type:complete len:249 (-) Transcript_77095:220-966(-)|eukprot:CAMPEP_0115279104 /NCGR_PEP_ID=MMETSP0270-20121206/58091_1 /TAXON_ID=71861 /ORGANISM="Scrippsiella trochoidea, Strain CCMP3099" /LENGTH=248 /DNA_ID=CAMNT_0002695781 /DNA_START=37 /DNA_END=783 /DNA_ORIENTATION=-